MHLRHDEAPTAIIPHVFGRVGFLLAASLLAIATVASAQVDYSRSADTVVIRFQELLGEVADGDQGPSIEIHGDGAVHVHYPAFMKRAGDYTTQLGAAEMDRLVAVIVEGGLADFDAAATRKAQATVVAARAATAGDAGSRPTQYIVLDASTTVIELDLGGVKRTIRWHGLRSDARRYPGVRAIQGLAQAQRELLTYMERGDLTRVTR